MSLKETVRKFVHEEVEPLAMENEKTDKIPENIINRSKEMGLFGLSIPEEYGGLGLRLFGKWREIGYVKD
jgi:acyl-CoA dehydrogenase